MKLSEAGDLSKEAVNELHSIAQQIDADGLELLRATHPDDNEALQYAASIVIAQLNYSHSTYIYRYPTI